MRRARLARLWLKIRYGRQWWFWTPEWQAGEREADADLAAGRSETYADDVALLAALNKEASS